MTSRMRVATGVGAGPDVAEATDSAAHTVAGGLDGGRVDVAVVFIGAAYADAAEEVRRRLAAELRPGTLVGVTAQGVVADAAEIEQPQCVSVWAACLPGAEVTALRLPPPSPGAGEPDWPAIPDATRGLVLLADPFSFPADGFLAWLHQAHPGLPVSGGMASGAMRPGGNRLLLDDDVHRDGAVAVALGGNVGLRHLVSQGCRPVGSSYVVTAAEHNVVRALGGEPPVERIKEIFANVDEADRRLMRGGLHLGIVIDEYAEEHRRGDFLVRGVLGAEAGTGALAVGDHVQVGQTVRFHVRDAASADEDLREMLGAFGGAGTPAGALLFTCNGRGSRLFGEPDHDAGLLRERLGELPLAGFFAAGEFGPVGPRSFVHGFTASVLAIDADPPEPAG